MLTVSRTRFSQRCAVGAIVLLCHVFLVLTLHNSGTAMPRHAENNATYMLAVPVVVSDRQRPPAGPTINPSTPVKKHAPTISTPTTVEESSLERGAPEQSVNGDTAKTDGGLDYEAMKRSARASAKEFALRTLPGTTRPLTPADRFENAAAQAKRGDCRTEHSSLGILAIPFLLKDTLTDSGCKW